MLFVDEVDVDNRPEKAGFKLVALADAERGRAVCAHTYTRGNVSLRDAAP
jgi:hypothetical protein